MLKYENEKLKKRIKDSNSKNYLYSEEIEKLKLQKQTQMDKSLLKKDNEIRRYKSQIVELKLEISKLQKKLEEKNSISNNTINSKKVNKPLVNNNSKNTNTNTSNNTGNKKSLRNTDSDFFLTSQKIVLSDNKKPNNEKIIINSIDKNDENKNEDKYNKSNVNKTKNIQNESKNKNEIMLK